MRTYPFVVLIVVWASILFAANPLQETDETMSIAPVRNPHWREDGCFTCHEQNQGKPTSIAPQEVDLLCLSCHDGVRASREPHPIGRSFAGSQVKRPNGWPLIDERLSCLTCHDLRGHCIPRPQRPTTSAAMLRGSQIEGVAYCGHCHIAELHHQHNPHIMLDAQGTPKPDSCRFCHNSDMQAGAIGRSGNSSLKSDELTLCGQCHKQHTEFFSPGHIGIEASHSVVVQLKRTDIRLGFANEKPPNRAALPLDGGKVVCSTCHNPHQAGVFAVNRELGLGAMDWPKSINQPTAQRLSGRELCSACHGF